MDVISSISLAIGTIALVFSLMSIRKASTRYISSVLQQKVRQQDLEIADLMDRMETVTRLVKRQTARENMRKHREQKKDNGKATMSDEEWRAWATKRIQQRLPVE